MTSQHLKKNVGASGRVGGSPAHAFNARMNNTERPCTHRLNAWAGNPPTLPEETSQRRHRGAVHCPRYADTVALCTFPPIVTLFSVSPFTLYTYQGCARLAGVPKSQSLMVTPRTGSTGGAGCGPL